MLLFPKKQKYEMVHWISTHRFFILLLVLCYCVYASTSWLPQNEMVKGRSLVKITIDQCKRKILGNTSKGTKCFGIDQKKACNQTCLKLARKRCGRTNAGQVAHYQCKNKQEGIKKACCCEFRCDSLHHVSKKGQRVQPENVIQRTDCECSLVAHSKKELEKNLETWCSNGYHVQDGRVCRIKEINAKKFICEGKSKYKGVRCKTIWKDCMTPNKCNSNQNTNRENQLFSFSRFFLKNQISRKSEHNTNSNVNLNSVIILNICKSIKCSKNHSKVCASHCQKERKKYGQEIDLLDNEKIQPANGIKISNIKECKCCCEPICLQPNYCRRGSSNKQVTSTSKETMEAAGFGNYGDPFSPENVNDGHLRR